MLPESDVSILIMGLTGSGKSAFIQRLVDEDCGIGHGLLPATTGLGFHCFQDDDRRVFLIDTPGFNEPRLSDVEVFKQIAFFLGQAYKCGTRVGGILYLHRITDNRVSGSAARGFSLVEKMCGPEAARSAILITTMWDSLSIEGNEIPDANRRHEELANTNIFWGSMQSMGARAMKCMGTRKSSQSILSSLLERFDRFGPLVMRIQKELIDEQRDLDQTSAGIELSQRLGAEWQKVQQELTDLTHTCQTAVERKDRETIGRIKEQKQDLQQHLKTIEAAERELRVSRELLFREGMTQYQ